MMNPIRYALAHLPGWNSLETVDRLATYSSWCAIIGGLGILMILELVAHVYSGRREELIGVAHAAEISGLKAEREAAVQKLVVQAEDKVVQERVAERVAAVTGPRTIEAEARQRMQSILVSAGSSPVRIRAYNSNPESVEFAHTIADIFKASGWKVEGPILGLSGTGPAGVWVQVPPPKEGLPVVQPPPGAPPIPAPRGAKQGGLVSIDDLPSPVKQLVRALQAGEVKDVGYFEAANLQPGEIELYVGGKVPH